MGKLIDLTGKTFGELKVTQRNGMKGHYSCWDCLCKCGIKCNYSSEQLRKGIKKCCGCKFFGHNWTGYMELSGSYITEIKNKAKRKNLKFELNKKYLWNLFIKQNKLCVYSRLPINFARDCKRNWKNQTASLDRINSEKGYIKGNVQWVHKDINFIKYNLSEQEFIKICHKISNKKNEINKTKYTHLGIMNYKGYKTLSGQYYSIILRGAKERNIDFNLDVEDIWEIYEKQNYVCAISGIKIEFDPRYRSFKQTASVDRIDSTKGYTKDNVQIIHKTINLMKRHYEQQYFLYMCKLVAINNSPIEITAEAKDDE